MMLLKPTKLAQVGLISFLISMCFISKTFAQSDTVFYVPPILDWTQNVNPSTTGAIITLQISTRYPSAKVTIRTPDNSFSRNLTVTSSAVTSYTLPLNSVLGNATYGAYDKLSPFAVRSDIGLIISSDYAITVIEKMDAMTNKDLIVMKGQSGLGTDFYAGAQTRVGAEYSAEDRPFIGIMATKDGTVVTVSGNASPFYNSGTSSTLTSPLIVSMNKGEAIMLYSDGATNTITGTRIRSNNDISVTSGSQHARETAGDNNADAGIDNLVATDQIGTKYIAVVGNGFFSGNSTEYAVIVATQPNTVVSVDGVAVATITGAGQFYTILFASSDAGRPKFIETSKNAYVYQVSGRNTEVGMAILPQIECTGDKQIRFQTDALQNQNVNFIVPTSSISNFRLNGQSTASLGVTVRTVSGIPNWSTFTFTATTNTFYTATANERFHVGVLASQNALGISTGLYGFISGFDQGFTLFDIYNTTVPTNGFTSLSASCPGTSFSNRLTISSCGTFHSITGYSSKFGSTLTTSASGGNLLNFTLAPPNATFRGCDTLSIVIQNDLGQVQTVKVEACWGPTVVSAGNDVGACGTSSYFRGVTPRFGTGRWLQLNGPTTANIVSPTSPTSSITGLATGTYNFRWSVTFSGCTVVNDDMVIVVVCAPDYPVDADGDGILNINDLDDDNDGISDAVEYCGVNNYANPNPEKVTNGFFSLAASGVFPLAPNNNLSYWRSAGTYTGNNLFPNNGQVAMQNGNINYSGGLFQQVAFPGDASYGISASQTYLLSNGSGGSISTTTGYAVISQTITGLTTSTSYIISGYVSNAVANNTSTSADPLLYFYVNGASVPGSNITLFDDLDAGSGHGGVDQWDRWQVIYTTSPAQTSFTLSVVDRQIGNVEDAFAITGISVKQLSYGCLASDPLSDDDNDGVRNYKDSDYCNLNLQGVCSSLDNDSDGVINSIDLDSDNDGIYDLFESNSGATDANLDGKIDGVTTVFGTNGLANTLENNDTQLAIINYSPLDSDGAGSKDYLSGDSDNDGCSDAKEAGFFDLDNDYYLGNSPFSVSTNSGIVLSNGGYSTPLTSVVGVYYYRTASYNYGCNAPVALNVSNAVTISGVPAINTLTGLVSSLSGSTLVGNTAYVGVDNDGTVTGISISSIPSKGSLFYNGIAITATGLVINAISSVQFTYSPFGTISGIDTFTYRVIDASQSTSTNTGTYSISIQNRPPVVSGIQSISTVIGFLGNGILSGFSDFDNTISQLTISGLSGTVNTFTGGSVTIGGTGTIRVLGTTPGVYVVASQVCDPFTCTSFNLNVTIVGQVPIAVANISTTNEGLTVSGNVLTNDQNPNTGGNTVGLTLTGFTNTSNPAVGALSGTTSGGYFTFTPNVELAQNVITTTSYNYTVCNETGCSSSSLTITVIGVNDAPVVTGVQSVTTTAGSLGQATLSGFSDVDNSIAQLTISGISGTVTAITGGAVTIGGTGIVRFQSTTPGVYVVASQVCDPFTCTSFNLNVTIVGQVPIAVANTATTNEGITISGNVLTNDQNPNTGGNTVGLTLTGFTNTSNPAVGALSGTTSGGNFIFTPNVELAQNVITTTSYNYTVCNETGCSSSSLTITVIGVNDVPAAVNLTISGLKNTTISGVISGFSDPDGTIPTVTNLTTTIGVGGVTISGTSVTFIPNLNFTGSTTIGYNVCDGFTCTGAFITFSVSNTNSAPTAINLNFTGFEDTIIPTSITGWFDIDNDPLTVSITGFPTNGSLSGSSFNRAYTPNSNFNGIDSYTYLVSDPIGLTSSIRTVTITVTAVNDAPIVTSVQSVTTTAGSLGQATLSGFSDVDNSIAQLTISGISGTVTTINGGSVTIGGTGMVRFQSTTPGVYVVASQVCDPFTCTSFNLNVTIVGQVPIAVANTATTNEGLSVLGNVLTNDQNPNTGGNTIGLTLTGFTNTSNPTVGALSGTTSGGNFTFTPNVELAQNVITTTSYNYTVCNETGCSSSSLTITVVGVNDAPVVTGVQSVTTTAGSLGQATLSGFSDVDNATAQLTISGISGTVTAITGGAVTIGGTGIVRFQSTTPGVYVVASQICDPFTCTSFNLNVTIVGQVPIAVANTATTNEGLTVSGNVLTNDQNPNTGGNTVGLTLTGFTNTSNPTVGALSGTTSGGNFTFTPNVELAQNVITTTSYNYTVCNETGCSSSSLTITVIGVNDAPVVSGVQSVTTTAGSLGQATLSGFSDVDNSIAQLTISGISGTVTAITGGAVTIGGTGMVRFQSTTPGVYVVVSQICDPFTCTSFNLNVTIVGQVPIAVANTATTNEGLTVSGNVLTNDQNPNTGGNTVGLTLTGFTNTSNPAVGALSGTTSGGNFTFTPNVELAQNVITTTSYNYTVCNETGCSSSSLTITVIGVNDAPVVSGVQSVTTTAGSLGQATLSGFSDVDNSIAQLTISGISGTVTAITGGAVTIGGTGMVRFQSTTPGVYVVVSQICDPFTCTSFNLNVTIVGQVPIAVANTATTNEGLTVSGNVLTNDQNPNTGGNTVGLTLTGFTNTSNPTVGALSGTTSGGNFTFTPNVELAQNVITTTSYNYTVCNVTGCVSSTLIITVIGVNDAPIVLTNQTFSGIEDIVFTRTISGFSDVDNTSLTLSLVSLPSNGSISLNSITGAFTYSPTVANYFGLDGFTYQVCDPFTCTSGLVTFTISGVNDGSIAVNDVSTANFGEIVTINAAGNDIPDPEGNTLNFTILTTIPGSIGFMPSATISGSTGLLTFQSATGGVSRTDRIIYQVCDTGSPIVCTTAQVSIILPKGNLPPVVIDDNLVINEDNIGLITITGNDYDPNSGDVITAKMLTVAGNGIVSLNTITGALVYTPNANYNGSDIIGYQVCDQTGTACGVGFVRITINPVNDPPIAISKTLTGISAGGGIKAISSLAGTDIDGTITTFTISGIPSSNRGVLLVAGVAVTAPGYVLPSSVAATIQFTPNVTFSGTVQFSFYAGDNGGLVSTAAGTYTFSIAQNQAPTASNALLTGAFEDTIFMATIPSSAFIDPDGVTPTVQSGVFTTTGGGTVTVSGNGSLVYVPNSNYFGTDSFTYNVCDAQPLCSSLASISISVVGVNDLPIALAVTSTGVFVTKVLAPVGTLTGSDVDGAVVGYVIKSVPAIGNGILYNGSTAITTNGVSLTVAEASTLKFTPNVNFVGDVVFTYAAVDIDGAESNTVNWTIPVLQNNPPTFGTGSDGMGTITLTGLEDEVLTADLSIYANDANGDNLLFLPTETTTSKGALLTITSSGMVTYVPQLNFNGQDSFTAVVCDVLTCPSALVIVNIIPVNDLPYVDMTVTGVGGGIITATLTGGIVDPDGDVATITSGVYTTTGGGLATIVGDIITYNPPPGYQGQDSVSVIICDPTTCVSTVIIIDVTTPNNRRPIAINDTVSTSFGNILYGNVGANDTDPDTGQTLSFQLIGTLPGLTFNSPAPVYTFNTNNVSVGFFTCQYKVCDDGNPSLCDTASIVITVSEGINPVPPNTLTEPNIPKGISPNGDDDNQFFVITQPPGWESYKINIKIYNRWGGLVFEDDDYKNTWEGKSNRGVKLGENLPDGTYFYDLEMENGFKKLGFVVIQR